MNERESHLISYERVPTELRAFEQWVNWRAEDRRKLPVNPKTLGNAGVHWPNTWAPFPVVVDSALRHELGVGFVLTADDPYTCIDLDDCVGERGEIGEGTRAILDLLAGWVELSPSGTGLHVWVQNQQPINRRTKGIEVYSEARWITVTGRSNPQALAQIPDRTRVVEELLQRYFPDHHPNFVAPVDQLDDDEIWQRLFRSRSGSFFHSLYVGDISVCHNDHSRAVIMLANQLALLTEQDAQRMKRLLYQTGLANEKWEEKRGKISWIDYQIQDAITYIKGKQ